MRFIPTPVGNSYRYPSRIEHQTVHPHACGELFPGLCHASKHTGSSPRLWGTLQLAPWPWSQARFIPTPVGNSVKSLSWVPLSPVHPHACGELYFKWSIKPGRYGSSPRLWGTLFIKGGYVWIPRFIPTPVGNSSSA